MRRRQRREGGQGGSRPGNASWEWPYQALIISILDEGGGVLVGLGAAWAATRVLGSMLYGLSPRDPVTMIGAAIVLIAVATLAAFIPAWRASRVDPMTALRYE